MNIESAWECVVMVSNEIKPITDAQDIVIHVEVVVSRCSLVDGDL